MSRIHWSEVWKEMDKKDRQGNSSVFSIKYLKRSTGEVRYIEKCMLSSIHAKGATLNIKEEGASRPKTIRKCLVLEFNSKSVYL